jgi:hypothetical protein
MVRVSEVPPQSLLGRCVTEGGYADSYVSDVPFAVTHAQFVRAFYTTRLFRIERLLLRLFLARPSTDAQVALLADGKASAFAAWTVESRADNEIVLAAGRTRSWLMVAPDARDRTRLSFGSAVMPRRSRPGGRADSDALFTALLGFHRI